MLTSTINLKKGILTLVATIVLNINYSQSISIGLETGHAVSFNSIDPNNGPLPQHSDVSNYMHESDMPAYSFSNAINVKTKLLNNLALINTVGQTRIGFNEGPFFSTLNGNISGSPETKTIYKQQFNYLDVSTGIQYYIPLRNIKLYVHTSFEYNYLTSHYQKRIERDYASRNIISTDNDNRTISRNISRNNVSVNGGLGLEFNITNNIQFFSHLNYKNMLLVIAPDSMTQDRLFSYGIKLGARIGL